MLVDTDVFSFIFRGDPQAQLYSPHVEGKIAALSFQTVGELLQGAYQRGWGEPKLGRQRAEIQRYLVVPFHWEMVEHFARLRAHRRSIGREIRTADAWIAATALWLDWPVVTHNVRDFKEIPGLTVITEYRTPAAG